MNKIASLCLRKLVLKISKSFSDGKRSRFNLQWVYEYFIASWVKFEDTHGKWMYLLRNLKCNKKP